MTLSSHLRVGSVATKFYDVSVGIVDVHAVGVAPCSEKSIVETGAGQRCHDLVAVECFDDDADVVDIGSVCLGGKEVHDRASVDPYRWERGFSRLPFLDP